MNGSEKKKKKNLPMKTLTQARKFRNRKGTRKGTEKETGKWVGLI